MSRDLSPYLLALVCVASLAARADDAVPVVAASVSPEPAGLGGWQCQRPGRFSNPDDPSCRTYLTCIPEEGSLTQRKDECGPNALFSGRYQRCIAGSDCETLDDFYAIEYECAECGKFVLAASTDCRQFVNCLKTKDPGVFVPIRQSCPVGKLFSAAAHGCVEDDAFECAPPTSTTPPAPQTTPPAPLPAAAPDGRGGHLSDFVCLGPGRFPDESVPHCRGYRWCIAPAEQGSRRRGQLVSRNFLCDEGHVFSEPEERCVPTGSYQCPDDGDGGAHRFRCPAIGRFPDRGARECERYYHCQETSGGTLKALLEQCPGGTVFSWLTTRCVPSAEYVCPVAAFEAKGEPGVLVEAVEGGPIAAGRRQDEKEEEEEGDEEKEEEEEEEEKAEEPQEEKQGAANGGGGGGTVSRCSRSGRMANVADALCRTYFICTRDARGAWAKVLVRCPHGTIFSRAAGRCAGAELEPCGAAGPPSTPPSPARDASGEATDGTGSAEDLVCTQSVPLLPNPADRTCRTYFTCRGGPHAPTLHLLACPDGALFSAVAGRCVLPSGADDGERDDGSAGSPYRAGIDDEPLLPGHCTGAADPGSGDEPGPTITADAEPHVPHPARQAGSSSVLLQPTVGQRPAPDGARDDARDAAPDAATDAGFGFGSYSGPAPEYPCTATGRFADINSVDCRSYFLCKQQQPSGSLVSVHLTCAEGMVFSRNVNKCIVSSRHVC